MNLQKSLILLVVLATASCNKTEAPEKGKGSVAFAVQTQMEITDVTRSNISDITALPDEEDFSLTITDSENQVVRNVSVDETTGDYVLDAGDYTATAKYGDIATEGFDKPCFTGNTAFTIEGGDNKSVSIPVTLSNAIVKVACTEMFEKYYPDYSFKITTAAGTVIDFPKGENRGAFIDAYKFTIDGTLTNQGGSEKTFSKTYESGINPATCYTVTFDASNVGGADVTITFNDTTETVDLGDIELND